MEFDFDGYLLFDNLAPGPSGEDIFAALELNSAEVVHKRCFFYREHFRKKRCAVVKYISIEVANNALRSHNQKIVFGFKVYVLEIKLNISELAKTEGSLLECFPELETIIGTEVLVLNIDDSINRSGDGYSRASDLLTRFGPINNLHFLGRSNTTYGNFMIRCDNYSTALAAHIAYNNTVINGRTVTVAVSRRKFETIKMIMSKVYYSGETDLQGRPSLRGAIPTDWLEMEDGVSAYEGAVEKRQAPEQDIGAALAPQQDVVMDEEIWCVSSNTSLVQKVRQMNASGVMSELTRSIYAAVEELNTCLVTLTQRKPSAKILADTQRVVADYCERERADYEDQGHVGHADALYHIGPLSREVTFYQQQRPNEPEVACFAFKGNVVPVSVHEKQGYMIKPVQEAKHELAYITPTGLNLQLFAKQLNDYLASFSDYSSDQQKHSSNQRESVSQESEDVAKQPEATASKQTESVSQESEDVAKQPEAPASKQTESVSQESEGLAKHPKAAASKQTESVSQESEDVAKQPEAAASKQTESVPQKSEDVAKQPEAPASKQTESVSQESKDVAKQPKQLQTNKRKSLPRI